MNMSYFKTEQNMKVQNTKLINKNGNVFIQRIG